ncbi:flagellar assembly protein FliH [Heyndrickxia camelliae]|uniref:Flagellar assembly protein FliH n=1 Tax=Heyndrickxia camelliae TaxID=1707093 RepID=A0A2N3LR62_9BACI|nr:flagellar assembly protein FliH [Heyndrickxia camelliae]
MTSLSKIIKSSINTDLPGKIIGIKEIYLKNTLEYGDIDPVFEKEKEKYLSQFQHKAETMIQDAECHAQTIREQIEQEKAQWMQERQALIEEAKRDGFEKGLIEGRNQGMEEYRSRVEEANQMVEHTKNEFIKHIEESEKVILDLGIKAAEKILYDTLSEQPEKFLSLVKQTIKEVRENQEIKIMIHPSKYSLINSHKDELDGLLAGKVQFYIYGDDQLSEYQCVVETENGRIDASIDSQLRILQEKLHEILEGAHL